MGYAKILLRKFSLKAKKYNFNLINELSVLL